MQLFRYGQGRRLMMSRDIAVPRWSRPMRCGGDFVANVSHEDVRTPLTVLSGFVETMQSLPLAEAPWTGSATWPDGPAGAPHAEPLLPTC
ncbi:MAG: hypothetical protein U1F00_19060 [Rhodoferax sp.]